MMPERSVSKIMRTGLAAGLLFMFAGVLVSFTGNYTEEIKLTLENLLNGKLMINGAGLMYLGTLLIILTPVYVLVFLGIYYMLKKDRRYGMYCFMIVAVLTIVVFLRFS